MDILTTLTAIGGAATGINSVAGLIGRAATFLNAESLSDEGFIRAYYLEVSKNIEILKTVDSSALRKLDIRSAAFKTLVNSLDMEIGVALLCSDERKSQTLLEFLAEGFEVEMHSDLEENPAAVPVMVDVRKAVWFTVQRVELLKGLSALEGDIFKHGFYLDIRIRNILDHLSLIRIKLEDNPAVKSVRQSARV